MRILITDDNAVIRRGIAGLLALQPDFEVCGEATDSADAIQKTADVHPDLVLLDVSMPGTNGLDTARILKRKFPELKILILTHHDREQLLPYALAAGANGCVDKARMAIDLLPAIRNLQATPSPS